MTAPKRKMHQESIQIDETICISPSRRSHHSSVLVMSHLHLQQFFFLTAWYLVILQGMHLSTSRHEHPLPATQLKFQHTPHRKKHISRILYLVPTANNNSRKSDSCLSCSGASGNTLLSKEAFHSLLKSF